MGLLLRYLVALLTFSLGLGFAFAGPAHATTRVQVIDTWPAGNPVMLARNQEFYLRLGYETDEPVRIWVAPYFRGEPAKAGMSPSLPHTGTGEALAWFFPMEPGVEVDEIRIRAGDGGTRSTTVVARYRVHIVGSNEGAAAGAPPAWVSEMRERDERARRQAAESAVEEPLNAIDSALFVGFFVGVPTLGLFGIIGPLWFFRRWQGGWRIAVAVPGIMMLFVVLRIVVGVALRPTSHNLWPFEILLAGAASTGATIVLWVLHRFSGTGRVAR